MDKRTTNKRDKGVERFYELVKLIDSTDFRRHPYRGVITRVAPKLGYTARSLHSAIKVYRTPRAMMAVAREIHRIHDELERWL